MVSFCILSNVVTDKAGSDTEGQHHEHQDGRSCCCRICSGSADALSTRRPDLQGQSFARAEWIQRADRRRDIPHLPADIRTHACGVKKRGGFAEASAGCQDDAGHDRSNGCRQHDLPDGLEMGRPQCEAAFLEAMRQRFQRIIGGRSDKRQRQDGHRQSACEEVPLGSDHDDKDQVAKKADHDRRERG